MELHQLRSLCVVVATGSFTRAAELEGISQPSLSQQIRKLEQTMGAPLVGPLPRSSAGSPNANDLELLLDGLKFYERLQEIA